MNEATKAKIAANWATLKQSYGAKVVLVASTVGSWWVNKTPLEQSTWLQAHADFAPLVPYAGAIGLAFYVFFRLWPQVFPHTTPGDPRLKQLDDLLTKANVLAGAPAPGTVSVTVQPAAPQAAAPIAPVAGTSRDWSPEERLLWTLLTKARASRNAPPIDSPLP